MNKLLLAAALVLAPASAHAMTAGVFLTKAEALMKKGPMALFSKDVGRLKGKVQRAGETLRQERVAAQKAGQPPAYCTPAKGAALNSDELIAHLRTIPPAQRERMTMKDALRGLLVRKYPCAA